MAELRTPDQRKSDVLAVLEGNPSGWLATATGGRPHVIAVSATWSNDELLVATREKSRTARNLTETRRARLAIGPTDDAVVVDVELVETLAPGPASGTVGAAFVAAQGWDPAEEGPDWRYFRLRPTRIQAFRGYGEIDGRDVMRDGRWLA